MNTMKTYRFLIFVLAIWAGAFPLAGSTGHEAHKKADASAGATSGKLVAASEADAGWLAKARADYPLNECVVSGDEFDGGPMGKPNDFVYRVEGQSDRLVRFCCEDCIDDFNEEPAKYLAEIDTAAKSAKKK
jgi:hypothetical protein